MLVKFLKIIGIFFISYFALFAITFLLANISKLYFWFKKYLEQKEIDLKHRPQNIPKKDKPVKKTWNESLGIWEIE